MTLMQATRITTNYSWSLVKFVDNMIISGYLRSKIRVIRVLIPSSVFYKIHPWHTFPSMENAHNSSKQKP